ncbi:MAG: ribonuclease P protein component [Clostridiales bacterium]|nr:ribonuclease P protein component [Clostridiales bacterium]
MKSIYRLKKNYQYNYVYKHASSVADKNFILLYCASNNKQSKVGFSVSKKYGKAVQRNRIRRQLKAAVSTLMPNVKEGFNAVFIPRRHEEYRYDEIVASVQKLFEKAGLLQ